ncbi:hypothetical protein, partial [Rhizobium leguminosarum]|uniref:hypothetical protein n=1 Tax=Rhizobium leguminosarum TaxID=384 RepID=UPI003F99B38F
MIDSILDKMTLEEHVSLLSGADFWTTVPVERLDIADGEFRGQHRILGITFEISAVKAGTMDIHRGCEQHGGTLALR